MTLDPQGKGNSAQEDMDASAGNFTGTANANVDTAAATAAAATREHAAVEAATDAAVAYVLFYTIFATLLRWLVAFPLMAPVTTGQIDTKASQAAASRGTTPSPSSRGRRRIVANRQEQHVQRCRWIWTRKRWW